MSLKIVPKTHKKYVFNNEVPVSHLVSRQRLGTYKESLR
jgi:hypothetical protein